MKYSEARQGRVFVIRLEDGDVIHEEIEKFARDQGIKAGALILLGGADKDSTLVVGPDQGRAHPILPMTHVLDNVHEVTGTGTLFPDEDGNPVLHTHIVCGRETSVITGCVREGVRVWHVMEVILFELVDSTGIRAFEAQTGFSLLRP